MKIFPAAWRCAMALAFAATTGIGANADAAVTATVYAEGAYTDSDLVVYLYANIAGDALVSSGVKIMFNNRLAVAPPLSDSERNPSKNDAVWYFSDGVVNYPYMNPEVKMNPADNSGEILFLGGKLDTSKPNEGVAGSRVLLGKVRFDRTAKGEAIPTGMTPENFFGISLDYAKGGNFVNFSSIAEGNVDANVSFSSIVRQRGDANKDGKIDSADAQKIREIFFKIDKTGYSVFADANADGKVDSADAQKVREIFFRIKK